MSLYVINSSTLISLIIIKYKLKYIVTALKGLFSLSFQMLIIYFSLIKCNTSSHLFDEFKIYVQAI